MFSFGRILKGCTGGCQLLWSDPNKQAGAYDAVEKDDREETDELDLEQTPASDIVFSQPIGGRRSSWSLEMESPIVRNLAPIVRNTSKTSSLERNAYSVQDSLSTVKTRTPPRNAFAKSSSPTLQDKAPHRNPSFGRSTPIVKSKSSTGLGIKTSTSLNQISNLGPEERLLSASAENFISKSSSYGPIITSSKSSKKKKKTDSEMALQVVSVV